MNIYERQYNHSVKWLPVLMYHRVVEAVRAPNDYNVQISTAEFDAQLGYLRSRGFQAIRLDDVPLAISDRSPWQKPVAISFDDGYRDNLTHALPILMKHGFPATIMLPSKCIGGRNEWDEGKAEPAPLLTFAEIQTLDAAGICFGAHGTVHLSLADVDRKTARRELAESKAMLEDLLGREISTFAYPYGRSTPIVHDLAQETGYKVAFGVDQTSHDLFNFSRIDAVAFMGAAFRWRLKVAGVHHSIYRYGGVKVPNRFRESAGKVLYRLRRKLEQRAAHLGF